MPWSSPHRHPFTEASIRANAPSGSGVYMVYDSQRWIYIGESGDIQARLLQHVRGDNECITRMKPTMFSYELVAAHQRVAHQNELVLELRPVCNERLG